ncbi:MAG: PQQ-binding-like beta-propeller repeat protein [Candidatus Eisenbacteria sp.]|nr:PQQ-binding-like beta-propeller repeat protein [Candidatus Eisenbacteria bacterium]
MQRSIRTIIFLAIASVALAGELVHADRASWLMFHGDRQRSGYSINDAPFDSMLAWEFQSDSIFYSSAVVGDDGTIYIATVSEKLLALSPYGELLWTFSGAGNFRYSTPAIGDDGTVYIGGADGKLYAVNPDSTLRWTYTAGAPIKTSPCLAADGTIYFGADDGLLYAINPDSSLQWSYSTGDTIRSSPAVGPDGTVFCGSMDSYLYAIWPTGGLRWRAATGGQIKLSSPAVDDSGVVYFGSYDGFVYAVSSDQKLVWAYPTEHVVRSSPAIGPEGRIFVASGMDLLAITPDGDLEWSYGTNGTIYSSPVYFGDDHVIAFGSDDGVFYCIHEDGSTDWTFTIGEPIRTTPGPGTFGNIYAADLTGKIHAFGTFGDVAVDEDWLEEGRRLAAAPNPFTHRVLFRFPGRESNNGEVLIHDPLGRLVARPRADAAGTITWDGRDRQGRPLPPGTYFYRLVGTGRVGRIVRLR